MDYARSIYSEEALFESRTLTSKNYPYGGAGHLGMAFWISQFLFFAPRSTLESLIALKSIHHARPEDVAQAAEIFTELAASREWTPVAKYDDAVPALFLLDRLQMIWTEIRDREEYIRMPAATKLADYL
jgi:hypothetical protein